MNKLLPQFNRGHGSLYDRGSADSYYRREPDPHWYPAGTYFGERIDNLSEEELAEYVAGFNANELSGSYVDY